MLPTKIAKPKVFNIQAFDRSVIKRLKRASKDSTKLKSFNIKSPSKIPLNKESNTLLVYSAKTIAKRDGTNDSIDVSILKL